jgi:SHS2 domain-containing protein
MTCAATVAVLRDSKTATSTVRNAFITFTFFPALCLDMYKNVSAETFKYAIPDSARMPAYRFLEGIAVADLAFEATGKSLEELFTNAAMAMLVSQADTKTITSKETRTFELENDKVEQLLFDFLNEIIFFKDAEQLIFKSVEVKITKNKTYKLKATFSGDFIDQKKHKLGNDLKAVTMHRFRVGQTKTGWQCTVVVDI